MGKIVIDLEKLTDILYEAFENCERGYPEGNATKKDVEDIIRQAELHEPKAEVKEECCECGNCSGTGRIRDVMENGDWGYVDCIVCEGKGKIKQKPK